jgi:predicted nucleotidyltransferase
VNAWDRLLETARNDEHALGVILSGSRGRGTQRANSDWDCCVVVRDGSESRDVDAALEDPSLDGAVFTLSEFRAYAAPGSRDAWNAYSFVHVRIAYDASGGEIARIADGKEFLEETDARTRAATALDAFVNAAVRAAKSRRAGLDDLSRLDAAESVAPALETIFALDGRIRPYNRYLRWEIERHPLSAPELTELPELVVAVAGAQGGAPERLFARIETAARENGLAEVLDAWDKRSLALARG